MNRRVKLTEEKLQKELSIAQERYNLRPHKGRENQVMGRILYWMKDPTAPTYLNKAIEISAKVPRKQSSNFLALGNLCRMAGDLTQAHHYFLQAYESAKKGMTSELLPDQTVFSELDNLIRACFMLERYAEAVEYGNMMRQENPDFKPDRLYEQFTLLAESKLRDNIATAELARDNLEWFIYSERYSLSNSGPITLWDVYDIALKTVADLQQSVG